jgi:hypothetical protein
MLPHICLPSTCLTSPQPDQAKGPAWPNWDMTESKCHIPWLEVTLCIDCMGFKLLYQPHFNFVTAYSVLHYALPTYKGKWSGRPTHVQMCQRCGDWFPQFRNLAGVPLAWTLAFGLCHQEVVLVKKIKKTMATNPWMATPKKNIQIQIVNQLRNSRKLWVTPSGKFK